MFNARRASDPGGCWQIIHNVETGQVYAERTGQGGSWTGTKYVDGKGADGAIVMLGYAKDRASLDRAMDVDRYGDPIGFLTGRAGSVDWVAARLAGSSTPPPP